MTDDRWDERLRDLARGYNAPPPDVPREMMWARIAAERARRRARRAAPRPAWIRWGLAAAAVLCLGVAIGRLSAPRPGAGVAAALPAASDPAYAAAAGQYLANADVLLTGLQAEAKGGRPERQLVAQAHDLLVTTRLLLDSPAGRDPKLKSLLEDLELVLAQVAQLPDERTGEDLQLITQGMDQRSVLLRVRAATPAPGAAARGAL